MTGGRSRTIVAALQVSLDGLIEGPNRELDWIGSWEDSFELLPEIDTCVLGGGMYPGVAGPHRLALLETRPLAGGTVSLTYDVV